MTAKGHSRSWTTTWFDRPHVTSY